MSRSVIVMGVSGCGKSTVGALIAAELGVGFIDGDALHPPANVRKMAAGVPLDDADRGPWLRLVGETLRAGDAVVACSALKRRYREVILAATPDAFFLHLDGTAAVLAERMQGRGEHFMPPSLLASQLATLEPLDPDEPGFVIDIDAPVAAVVAAAVGALAGR